MAPGREHARAPSGRTGTSSRRSPSSTATPLAPRHGQGLASSSSRCSSSPAPAPAAARRPYLKLLTQLFGDRLVVANATGCSSIYGGNLPTTPWTHERRRARPGVGELAVRGQRRVRPRACASASSSTRPSAPAAARRAAPTAIGADLADAHPRRRRSATEADIARPARAGRASSASTARRTSTDARARRLCAARRRAGAHQHLDRRRRRLGLRHRLRRPRPRARQRPQRQHARARHRGVLEHRRPGVEGHAARRGRQVRRRRQADRQEGPRRHRPRSYGNVYVAQVAIGASEHADGQGPARGRRVARPVAGHRLQPLHRPRHRHVDSR